MVLVNYNNPKEFNSLLQIVYVVLPVLFWSVANWSLTTLIDGEGKFSEIFTSTCFALTPLILIGIPWILLSNFISAEEASFLLFYAKFCCFMVFVLTFRWQYDSASVYAVQNSWQHDFNGWSYWLYGILVPLVL